MSLENIYLNEIPLDLFMKYFNKDNVSFNGFVESQRKMAPYIYSIGSYNYNSTTRYVDDFGNIEDLKKEVDVVTILPMETRHYKQWITTKEIGALKNETKNWGLYNNPPLEEAALFNLKLVSTKLPETLYLKPSYVEYTENAEGTIVEKTETEKFLGEIREISLETFYNNVALLLDSRGNVFYYKFFFEDNLGTDEPKHIFKRPLLIDDFSISTESKLLTIEGITIQCSNIEEENNPFSNDIKNSTYYKINKNNFSEIGLEKETDLRLLVIHAEDSKEPKKDKDGNYLFLDQDGNELKFVTSSSSFLQHHNLMSPYENKTAYELMKVTVPPYFCCLVNEDGRQKLSAYNELIYTKEYTLSKNKISSFEYDSGLDSYVYEQLINNKTYSETAIKEKVIDFFDFSRKNPNTDVEFDSAKGCLKPARDQIITTGFTTFLKNKYFGFIDEAKDTISYIHGKSNNTSDTTTVFPDSSDSSYTEFSNLLSFSDEERWEVFPEFSEISADDNDGVTTTSVKNYYSERFKIYFSITTSLKETTSKYTGGIFDSLNYPITENSGNKGIYSPATGKYYSFDKANKYKQYSVDSNNSPYQFLLSLDTLKERMIPFSVSTQSRSRKLLESGVFLNKRKQTFLDMNRDRFNKITNENYSINSSFIDANGLMKIFVYSNGLYNTLRNETGLSQTKINAKYLIDPSDLSTKIVLRKNKSALEESASLNIEYLTEEEINNKTQELEGKEMQLNGFQRILDYNGYGLSKEKIKANASYEAEIEHIKYESSSLPNPEISNSFTPSSYNYGKLKFKPNLISYFIGYFNSPSDNCIQEYKEIVGEKTKKVDSYYPLDNIETNETIVFSSNYPKETFEKDLANIIGNVASKDWRLVDG